MDVPHPAAAPSAEASLPFLFADRLGFDNCFVVPAGGG
jgi:hypothetical protein